MEFIKKNWKVIFIGVAILLLFVATVLRILTPATIPVVSSIPAVKAPTIKESNFSGVEITVSATQPEMPATLSVYQVTNTPISLSALATKLGLQTTDNGVHWYSQTGQSLSQDPYSNRIGYSGLGTDEGSTLGAPINKETAVTTATTFVKDTLQFTTLSADPSRITLRQSDFEDNSYDPAKADIAQIPFSYQVGGHAVFSDDDLFDQLIVKVNSQNKILGFTMSPNLVSAVTSEVKVKTISIEQLKTQIMANNVGVLQISSENPDGFTLQNLKSLDISSIAIEYRLNSQKAQVLPYYRIAGSALNLQGIESKLEIITPAIQTISQ